jgi:hypothetical protein
MNAQPDRKNALPDVPTPGGGERQRADHPATNTYTKIDNQLQFKLGTKGDTFHLSEGAFIQVVQSRKGVDPELDEIVLAVTSRDSSSPAEQSSGTSPDSDVVLSFIRDREARQAHPFGHEKVFAHLDALCRVDNDVRMAMISGPPGVGKTYLVKQYLDQLSRSGEFLVITFDALGDLKTQIACFMDSNNITMRPRVRSLSKLRHLMRECIYPLAKNKKVLLYFDNYDADSDIIREYFDASVRKPLKLYTLVTTSSSVVVDLFEKQENGVKSVALKSWDEGQVIAYSTFLYGDQLRNDFVRLLCKLCKGLPVMLDSIFHALNGRSAHEIDEIFSELVKEKATDEGQRRHLVRLLADRIWLPQLSEDAQLALALFSMSDPNHIDFKIIPHFFSESEVDIPAVIDELLSRRLLCEGVKNCGGVLFRFHQAFQKILTEIIFSKNLSHYPVAAKFSEEGLKTVKRFWPKFANEFNYDKYKYDRREYKKFISYVPDAERVVLSVSGMRFQYLTYDSLGAKGKKEKNVFGDMELNAIRSRLGNVGMQAIAKICCELAAYYLYQQHSYSKAHDFCRYGQDFIANYCKTDQFEVGFIKARLLTVWAGIYDCEKKRDRSQEKSEEAIRLFDFLDRRFPERKEGRFYRIAKATAYGTVACSYIHRYEKLAEVNRNDKYLERAKKYLNQAIEAKRELFDGERFKSAIFLNEDKLARIEMIKARKTRNYVPARKKLEKLLLLAQDQWSSLAARLSLTDIFFEQGELDKAVRICSDGLRDMSIPERRRYSVEKVDVADFPLDPRVIDLLVRLGIIFHCKGGDDKKYGQSHIRRAVSEYIRYLEKVFARRSFSPKEFEDGSIEWVFKDFYNVILGPLFDAKLSTPFLEAVDGFFAELDQFHFLSQAYWAGLGYKGDVTVIFGANRGVGKALADKLKACRSESSSSLPLVGVDISVDKKGLPILPNDQKIAALIARLAGCGCMVGEMIYCGPNNSGLLLSGNMPSILPHLKRLENFVSPEQKGLLVCPTHTEAKNGAFNYMLSVLREKLPKFDLCIAVHPRLPVVTKKKKSSSKKEKKAGAPIALEAVRAKASPSTRRRDVGSPLTRKKKTHEANKPEQMELLAASTVDFLASILLIERRAQSMFDPVPPAESDDVFLDSDSVSAGRLSEDDALRVKVSAQLSTTCVFDMNDPGDRRLLTDHAKDCTALSACNVEMPLSDADAPMPLRPVGGFSSPSALYGRAKGKSWVPRRTVSWSGSPSESKENLRPRFRCSLLI